MSPAGRETAAIDLSSTAKDATGLFIVKVDRKPIEIDYLIGGQALTGAGLGTRIIRRVLEETWRRYPTIVAVVVAVQQADRTFWRTFEKSGFGRLLAGALQTYDPSDQGRSYLYQHERPRTQPAHEQPSETTLARDGQPDR